MSHDIAHRGGDQGDEEIGSGGGQQHDRGSMERADGLRPSPLIEGMWDCWSVDCQAADWLSRAMEVRALIGWNLRRLRVAKGLSQERLALAAGIDRAYVGRVERGSRT